MIFKNKDEKLKKIRKLEETDDFWDVTAITPPRREVRTGTAKFDTEAVIISDNSYSRSDTARSQPIGIPELSLEPLFSFIPDNCLINNITVFPWHSKYTFYERFRLDARKYFKITHTEVQPISYFSYMPSYIQMSVRQREWYFYWRDCVRNKKYLPVDSSYVLLYVYEIINLPELISAEEGIELLCDIWEAYRKSYTKLDKFMVEWVCDYCIINKIALPYDRIAAFYDSVIECSSLKQFYIESDKDNMYADLLLEKTSAYRWRKSKYLTEENKDVFQKHIKQAFRYAVKSLAVSDGRFDGSAGRITEKKVIRDSFSGALCVYNVKKRIECVYFDLANEKELGFIVTDMVRYCENRIRAYLGVRARLSVQNLTEEHKKVLDEYFEAYLPCEYYEKKPRSVKTDKNEYEIHEEKTKPFAVSYDKAKEIERESWQTTDRLVSEYEFAEEDQAEPANESKENNSVESETLDIAKKALMCVAKKDMASFNKTAEECYMLPDTLAECVNELCFELFGDVGIEEKDGGYVLISDYEQEILEWLKL